MPRFKAVSNAPGYCIPASLIWTTRLTSNFLSTLTLCWDQDIFPPKHREGIVLDPTRIDIATICVCACFVPQDPWCTLGRLYMNITLTCTLLKLKQSKVGAQTTNFVHSSTPSVLKLEANCKRGIHVYCIGELSIRVMAPASFWRAKLLYTSQFRRYFL